MDGSVADAATLDGGAMVDGGVMVDAGCGAGLGDCNALSTDGCETDLTSSPAHCGACGSPCGMGETCVEGRCTCGALTAEASVHACPDVGGDRSACCGGTCRDLESDVANCGSCGRACTGMAGCVAGSCGCGGSFEDCNGDLGMAGGDGCETDTNVSPAHCGECSNLCMIPFAVEACAGGNCAIGRCNAGRFDCDDTLSNGCETAQNTSNCGGCGRRCNPGETCEGGRCTCGLQQGSSDDPPACGSGETCAGGFCTCGETRSAVRRACFGVNDVCCGTTCARSC